MSTITLKQTGKWLPADVETPISLFLGYVGSKQGILLESAEVDGRLGRYSIIAWNYRLRLSAKNGKLEVAVRDHRLEALKELSGMDYLDGVREVMNRLDIQPEGDFADLPPICRGLVGYFGYGVAGMFEPKLEPMLPPEQAETTLVLPGNVILFDHLFGKLCLLSLVEGVKAEMDTSLVYRSADPPQIGPVQNMPEEIAYKRGVMRAKELITQGEAIQIVLSTRFQASFTGEPFSIYRQLRRVNPSPYLFFMRLPGVTLMGSSPEMLVRCEDGDLTTCPIAGTRPRGKDHAEDDALAEELLADPKERAEHVMLVDLGRNDLGRIAKPGSVRVDKYMQIERFSHVMHITSYVKALLSEGKDALDVLASAFPAGTLSGAPKVRAMEIIAELEGLSRGPYAGVIGWLGLDKGRVDLDTGILIRSLWVRDGMVHWQAGAGIVFDSDPDKEWQECQNKARVLLEILTAKGGRDVFAHR
ncbi:anthranilate synthase component I family protein [Oceanidesulfovibrio marinus]|uniref:Anthranilate synthase component I family protein n=1 Tax=Oceanidesulfovibrio marinus TaxID=370038 RepID=A0A6P1ZKA9_9BACT|nr:anthranilate synthase component I family protein [Oceanidesulfovibrio marinus]QJT09871.1 anthranilate synthase component I family protein [Oceanidesulfovibrio marinus]TVM36012.1 anthranilate synthase component I family protein [Oceanidesulfovibrio marinus]